jgi:hypothetical protein
MPNTNILNFGPLKIKVYLPWYSRGVAVTPIRLDPFGWLHYETPRVGLANRRDVVSLQAFTVQVL